MKRHFIKPSDCHRNGAMRRVCAWVAGLLLAWPGASLAAYLPMIGPVPLRFEAPTHLPTASPLPLVQDSVPEPETNVTAAVPPPNTHAAPAQPESIVIVAKSPDPADATNAPPAFIGPIDASLVTPQMMMHFFQLKSGDTNGPNTDVVLPFAFTPPVPAPRPPSKASYFTP
jgi:hypothetical protein